MRERRARHVSKVGETAECRQQQSPRWVTWAGPPFVSALGSCPLSANGCLPPCFVFRSNSSSCRVQIPLGPWRDRCCLLCGETIVCCDGVGRPLSVVMEWGDPCLLCGETIVCCDGVGGPFSVVMGWGYRCLL